MKFVNDCKWQDKISLYKFVPKTFCFFLLNERLMSLGSWYIFCGIDDRKIVAVFVEMDSFPHVPYHNWCGHRNHYGLCCHFRPRDGTVTKVGIARAYLSFPRDVAVFSALASHGSVVLLKTVASPLFQNSISIPLDEYFATVFARIVYVSSVRFEIGVCASICAIVSVFRWPAADITLETQTVWKNRQKQYQKQRTVFHLSDLKKTGVFFFFQYQPQYLGIMTECAKSVCEAIVKLFPRYLSSNSDSI